MSSSSSLSNDQEGKTLVNEKNFHLLKKKLEELSYMYPLGPKSAPLVSRMLSDLLMITTSNKELSVKTTTLMSERDILAAEISPLRSENRRLVRENNQLHLEIIRQAEDFDRRERGLQQMMKKNEGDMKDATFISNQNNQLVEKYENEINSLKLRLQQSLERNLIAEKPDQSLRGGRRGDPIMQGGMDYDGTISVKQKDGRKSKYPQVIEWSGNKQNVTMTKKLCPSPKKRAPDPGGVETLASELNNPTSSRSTSTTRNTSTVVSTLTESLKAANDNINRLHNELEDITNTSRRSIAARDEELLRLSTLIENNGLSVVGGGINPPLMAGGRSDNSNARQQILLIEQLNDQIDYQNEQLSKLNTENQSLKKKLTHANQLQQQQESKKATDSNSSELQSVIGTLRSVQSKYETVSSELQTVKLNSKKIIQEKEEKLNNLRSTCHNLN
jgi:centrosomal protein CEP135